MSSPSQQSENKQLPNEFFDDSSFKTLYGGVMVTWVATSAIANVWESLDPKILGFIIALVVAFVGYYVTGKHSVKKLLITPFNGLLIYLTIMGGTSFLPPPGMSDVNPASNDQGENGQVERIPNRDDSSPNISSFFTSWNPNRDLIQKTSQLQQENQQLEIKTQQLQEVNTTYKTKLDSTRELIRQAQLPSDVQQNLFNTLDINQLPNFQPTINH